MPAKMTTEEFKKLTGEDPIDVLGSGYEDYGICDDCGESLPKPKLEIREGGHSEFITYCPCGATYKS